MKTWTDLPSLFLQKAADVLNHKSCWLEEFLNTLVSRDGFQKPPLATRIGSGSHRENTFKKVFLSGFRIAVHVATGCFWKPFTTAIVTL